MTRLNTSNPLQIRIVEGMDQAVKILKENPTVVNLSVDASMLLVGFKEMKKRKQHCWLR